jgi:putative ABC transport system ATP-binding protein
MNLMVDLRERFGMTFLFATHDARMMAHAKRTVTLTDGIISRDEAR